MSIISNRPGVQIIIRQGNKILLGKRHDNPKKKDLMLKSDRTWTLPGGKIDEKETLEDACCRETLEESGIEIYKASLKSIGIVTTTTPVIQFKTHGFVCTEFKGEPQALEPEKTSDWQWFDIDNLPENLFSLTKQLLNRYLKN
jgi:8-oxo-dGTP diphosphatase